MEKLTQREMIEITGKLVEDFSHLMREYLIKMGIPLKPEFQLVPLQKWEKMMTLDELVRVINSEIGSNLRYPKGVRTKKRDRYLVMRRQMGCYLARSMGYTYYDMASAFGINHATAIHGNRVAEELIETKDYEFCNVYRTILKHVNIYYAEKYGKDIS